MIREEFDQHPLWNSLESLSEVAADDLTGGDATRDDIDFIHAAVQSLQARGTVDPALVGRGSLDSIDASVTQARDYLTQYKNDPSTYSGYVGQQVRPALQTALDQARALPEPNTQAKVRASQQALERYRKSADSEIANLRAEIETLRSQLTEAGVEREQQAEQARTALGELEAKVQAGAEAVATQTTALQEQIDTQRTTFTEEADQRSTKFTESEAAHADQAEADRTQQKAKADEVLADLEQSREQAKALLAAVNDDVISGDYKGWAKKQASAAFGWTVTTVAVGLTTVGALIAVVLTAKDDSVQFLLSKSTVGIIGLILAGYTARQAAEHRHEERTANRLALDLAALEPYLEHVDDPGPIRTEIARRVFVPQSAEAEPARFHLGRRSMTMAEVVEFAKILRGVDQTGPST